MKILTYWSESNSWIYLYIVRNKNQKIWSDQNFTGLGPKDRCSSWALSWAKGPVLIVRTVLGRMTGAHCEDCLGPKDRCSSWGLSWAEGPVLIVRTVLGRRTGAHREDCLGPKGPVLIVRTVLGRRTGAHREHWLFNAKWIIFNVMTRQTTYRCNDEDICFILDQHIKLDFYSVRLNKVRHISRTPSQQVCVLSP
jgi:hypothetical protein